MNIARMTEHINLTFLVTKIQTGRIIEIRFGLQVIGQSHTIILYYIFEGSHIKDKMYLICLRKLVLFSVFLPAVNQTNFFLGP